MNIATEVARRVRAGIVDEMNDLRQAERDVALYAPEISGMAFDNAETAYETALASRGVSRDEMRNLSASAMRLLLKNLPRGADGVASAAAMAFDSEGSGSPLDSILKGIKPPRDISIRSDFRR